MTEPSKAKSRAAQVFYKSFQKTLNEHIKKLEESEAKKRVLKIDEMTERDWLHVFGLGPTIEEFLIFPFNDTKVLERYYSKTNIVDNIKEGARHAEAVRFCSSERIKEILDHYIKGPDNIFFYYFVDDKYAPFKVETYIKKLKGPDDDIRNYQSIMSNMATTGIMTIYDPDGTLAMDHYIHQKNILEFGILSGGIVPDEETKERDIFYKKLLGK